MYASLNLRFVVFAAIVLLGVAGWTHASPIAVGNYSFESPDTSSGYMATFQTFSDMGVPITSWTSIGAPTHTDDPWLVDRNSGGPASAISATPDPSDAEQMAFAYGRSWTTGMYQVLSATLQANTTYTLTVDLGRNASLGFSNATSIELGYGSTAGSNLLTGVYTANTAPDAGAWSTWTKTFTTDAAPAGGGQSLRIELVVAGVGTAGGTYPSAYFDNVRLDAATTPEPGTLALFTTGVFSLLAYAWRKRK